MSGPDLLDSAREVREGEELDEPRLRAYLADTLADVDAHAQIAIQQFPGGHSNLTYRFKDTRDAAYVLRRPPLHKRANSDETMRREARALAREQEALGEAQPLAPWIDRMGVRMLGTRHRTLELVRPVRAGARPVGIASGLREIAARAAGPLPRRVVTKGEYRRGNIRDAYIKHMLSYIDPQLLQPTKVVVNAGNGSAGPVVDALAERLPLELVRVAHEPDGTFPNGVPNPLLPEARSMTSRAVVSSGAELGVAWDGDFDRCFLFDGRGRFVDGYYLVGLLAKAFLNKSPGAKIAHDPRLVWNTIEVVNSAGGVPVLSRCGHTNMKDTMRSANAVYGGEMSGHHYFRDFAYCDSGMIPWLLVLELMARTGRGLAELVVERQRAFPMSGEINRPVENADAATYRVLEHYRDAAHRVSYLDGISMEFSDWRFNLRPSNTEPLLRLNVEARGDELLVRRKTAEILELLQ